jgi:hypothetical protein
MDMNFRELRRHCTDNGITFDKDQDPDAESYRKALLDFIAKTHPSIEPPISEVVADFRERYSSRMTEVLSFITRVKNLVHDDDISSLLSKLDISDLPKLISEEDFIKMRQRISEPVPSIIVAGLSIILIN